MFEQELSLSVCRAGLCGNFHGNLQLLPAFQHNAMLLLSMWLCRLKAELIEEDELIKNLAVLGMGPSSPFISKGGCETERTSCTTGDMMSV